MDYKQYEELKNLERKLTISARDLNDLSPRTLLYGFTCERYTHHVYIKDEQVHLLVYSTTNTGNHTIIYRNGEIDISSLIPDKRLYPESCELEFCKQLKMLGYYLPFTTFDPNHTCCDQYWGWIL